MKIYTSYFYKVRFLHTYEVPLSTAVWDPKWFHDFHGQDYAFLDRRGVLNGVRASMFAPDETCRDLCRGLSKCDTGDPTSCLFLQNYRVQLSKIDFQKFIINMQQLSVAFQEQLGQSRPVDFILLFHETPTTLCSERKPVQDWFKSNGFPIEEWEI